MNEIIRKRKSIRKYVKTPLDVAKRNERSGLVFLRKRWGNPLLPQEIHVAG